MYLTRNHILPPKKYQLCILNVYIFYLLVYKYYKTVVIVTSTHMYVFLDGMVPVFFT